MILVRQSLGSVNVPIRRWRILFRDLACLALLTLGPGFTQVIAEPRVTTEPFGLAPEIRPFTPAEGGQADALWRSLAYYRSHGGCSNALDLLPNLIALLERSYGPHHPVTITTTLMKAECLAGTSRYSEAEALFAVALPQLSQRLGTTNDKVIGFVVARASNLLTWGKPAAADPLLASAASASGLPQATSLQAASVAANVADLRLAQGRYREGEAVARQALSIRASQLPPRDSSVLSSKAMLARLLAAQGKYVEAAKVLGPDDAGQTDSVGAARVAETRGALLTAQARFIDAEAAYLKAGQLFVTHAGYSSPEAEIASAEWRLAVRKTREVPAGAALFQAKLPQMAGIRCERPPSSAAEVWELRVEAADRMPDDAAICRRLILAFYQQNFGKIHPETARASAELAESLNDLGNTDEAEASARDALAQRNTLLGDTHPETVQSLRLLGTVLAAQGRTEEAIAIAQRQAMSPGEIGLVSLVDWATLLDEQGRLVEAEPIWERAVEQSQKYPQDLPALIRVLGGYIFNQSSLGKCSPDWHVALAGLVEKKRLANPIATMLHHDDPLEEALAQSLACQGRWADAASLYEQMANAQMGKVAPAFGWYRPAAQLTARQAMLLSGNPATLDKALAAARQAVWIARTRRLTRDWRGSEGATGRRLPSGDTGGDPLGIAFVAQLKASWAGLERARKAGTSNLAAENASSGGEISMAELAAASYGWEAFTAAQDIGISAAARALLQKSVRSAVVDPQLAALIEKQQALTADLQERELSLFTGSSVDKQRFATLQADKTRLDALDDEVRTRFPAYAELVRPSAIDLRTVQSRLQPGEGMLYIQPAWNDVYIFAVSKNAFRWHKVAGTAAELDEKVRKLRCMLDGVSCHLGESSAQPFDRKLASEIYRSVIAPVEAAIQGSERVFVVASGALGGLPLALLPTGPDNDTDGKPAAWLIDKYAFITLPSVSSLRVRRASDQLRHQVDFVGFGDPVLGPPEEPGPTTSTSAARSIASRGATGLADPASVRELPSLPNTRRELMKIASALDAPLSSLHLGAAATEQTVRSSSAVRSAAILVFATHGLLPRSLDGIQEPGLVFTPPGRATSKDDGILTASEAAGLSLSADWLVLSACNTAASGSAGGEALSGLARSFLYAGARSLLASHWPVSDEATAALTSETFRVAKLRPELGHAKALQAAMQAVRTGRTIDGQLAGWRPEWADPWFWAPFVLIDTDS